MTQPTINMKGIILHTEQECIDLIQDIDSKFSFLFGEGTETYTHYVKHLSKDEHIVIIDKERISYLAEQFPEIFNSLAYGLDDVIEVNKNDYFLQEID